MIAQHSSLFARELTLTHLDDKDLRLRYTSFLVSIVMLGWIILSLNRLRMKLLDEFFSMYS